MFPFEENRELSEKPLFYKFNDKSNSIICLTYYFCKDNQNIHSHENDGNGLNCKQTNK